MIIAADTTTTEARRVMEVCNACRYCEGICATFQAMTGYRSFADTDLDYLANLCHNCTACYHDCQYSPPHEFNINVPVALADARVSSYERYAWPASLAGLFHNNGLIVTLVMSGALVLLLGLAMVFLSADVLFGIHSGPGSFYQVIGQGLMVTVAGVTFGFAVLSLCVGLVGFWRATGGGMPSPAAFIKAVGDAATLKHLDGGHGEGCSTVDDAPSNSRRVFHQLTMWGFVLCFLSTCVAAIYDNLLGLIAPYPFFSIPVLLGTVGGVGLLIGPVGLIVNKLKSDPRPQQLSHLGMDYAFLVSLFLVSLTGLVLLAFRETSFMGILLVIHLGLVLGFFVILPYSKFVHGVYRFAALVRFASASQRT